MLGSPILEDFAKANRKSPRCAERTGDSRDTGMWCAGYRAIADRGLLLLYVLQPRTLRRNLPDDAPPVDRFRGQFFRATMRQQVLYRVNSVEWRQWEQRNMALQSKRERSCSQLGVPLPVTPARRAHVHSGVPEVPLPPGCGPTLPATRRHCSWSLPRSGCHQSTNSPKARGFLVSRADFSEDGADRIWIALCRRSAGSLDLFAMMADDVALTLEGLRGADNERLFTTFLARIRAWQDFMRRGGDGVLGPEAEVGLFGELELLRDIILAGLPAIVAVRAWQGPLDGVQDFALGVGAIEVKCTVSPGSFPATVGSLDQLDDSLGSGRFTLPGVRLALTAWGRTLPRASRRTARSSARGTHRAGALR